MAGAQKSASDVIEESKGLEAGKDKKYYEERELEAMKRVEMKDELKSAIRDICGENMNKSEEEPEDTNEGATAVHEVKPWHEDLKLSEDTRGRERYYRTRYWERKDGDKFSRNIS